MYLQVQEYFTEQKWLDKWTGDFIYMLAWADLVAVTADLVCEVSTFSKVESIHNFLMCAVLPYTKPKKMRMMNAFLNFRQSSSLQKGKHL